MPLIVTGADYLTLPRAAETWLVEPLIPTSGACILYGDPKVGKSFAALQLAQSIQAGNDWLGFPVRTKGPVVYVQLDTPRSLWATRLADVQATQPPEMLLPLCADRETLDTFPFDILNQSHADLLTVALREINPVAVIIDTIREAHSGDENDSTTMRNVVSSLVAATHPAALILVAHSRKAISDKAPDLMNDNRGNGYVVGRMDTIIRFTKKAAHYNGRAIEEGSLRIQREDNGLWSLMDEGILPQIDAVLNDSSLTTVRARAMELAIRVGKTEEAARSILRRHALSTHTESASPQSD